MCACLVRAGQPVQFAHTLAIHATDAAVNPPSVPTLLFVTHYFWRHVELLYPIAHLSVGERK